MLRWVLRAWRSVRWPSKSYSSYSGLEPATTILFARIPFQGLWYWRKFWDVPVEVEQIR